MIICRGLLLFCAIALMVQVEARRTERKQTDCGSSPWCENSAKVEIKVEEQQETICEELAAKKTKPHRKRRPSGKQRDSSTTSDSSPVQGEQHPIQTLPYLPTEDPTPNVARPRPVPLPAVPQNGVIPEDTVQTLPYFAPEDPLPPVARPRPVPLPAIPPTDDIRTPEPPIQILPYFAPEDLDPDSEESSTGYPIQTLPYLAPEDPIPVGVRQQQEPPLAVCPPKVEPTPTEVTCPLLQTTTKTTPDSTTPEVAVDPIPVPPPSKPPTTTAPSPEEHAPTSPQSTSTCQPGQSEADRLMEILKEAIENVLTGGSSQVSGCEILEASKTFTVSVQLQIKIKMPDGICRQISMSGNSGSVNSDKRQSWRMTGSSPTSCPSAQQREAIPVCRVGAF